jgi:hypothetical protein
MPGVRRRAGGELMFKRMFNLGWLLPVLACVLVLPLCAFSFSRATIVVLGWQGSSDGGRWSPFRGMLFTNGAAVLFYGYRQGPHIGPFADAGRSSLRGREHVHLAESSDQLWWRPGRVAPTGLGIGGHEGWLSSGFSLPSALVAVGSFLPLLIRRTRRVVRLPRNAAGLCPVCKYDLRATPDRCPECGAVPAAR